MTIYRLPLARWVEDAVEYLLDTFGPAFNAIGGFIGLILNSVQEVLLTLPWWLIVLLFVVVAWKTVGRMMALYAFLSFLFILSLDLWDQAMVTLALVVTSTSIASIIGVPLGILAAKNDWVERVFRPILDTMQTLPSFVYLIPALTIFGLGGVPSVVATVVFSMPPAVRLANLGIRQVPAEVIESARAFGTTPSQLLLKVQLPLALPTIMAGINQTLMLALSMAVIAAMIGAGGLGGVVWQAITRVKIGPGFEGGLSLVVMAILLDRISQSIGGRRKKD